MQTYKYFDQTVEDKNVFIGEYFSGPDVTIRIVNDFTNEIVEIESINYDLQEQLLPIYGYNSSVCDEIAVGQRIIVGEFTVNVKNETKNIDLNLSYSPSNVDEYDPNRVYRPGWVDNNNNNINSNITNENLDKFLTNVGNIYNGNSYVLQYSDEIKNIQRKLLELGYDVVVNGYYDLKTRQAISEYQKYNNLKITGTVTDEFKNELFNDEKYYDEVINECQVYSSPSIIASIVVGTLKEKSKVNVVTEVSNFYFIKNDEIVGYVEKNNIKMLQ